MHACRTCGFQLLSGVIHAQRICLYLPGPGVNTDSSWTPGVLSKVTGMGPTGTAPPGTYQSLIQVLLRLEADTVMTLKTFSGRVVTCHVVLSC